MPLTQIEGKAIRSLQSASVSITSRRPRTGPNFKLQSFSSMFSEERTFDSSQPSIGIYGKLGEVKGTFDLIRALAALREDGNGFNFLGDDSW